MIYDFAPIFDLCSDEIIILLFFFEIYIQQGRCPAAVDKYIFKKGRKVQNCTGPGVTRQRSKGPTMKQEK
jgi:hypothetical protein